VRCGNDLVRGWFERQEILDVVAAAIGSSVKLEVLFLVAMMATINA